MALVPTGLLTSRGQQEHGQRALAACVHPTRQTMFMVAGQVVEEIDLRDGSLVYRIVSDLVDPIVRLEVTSSSRGHEYLVLLSASSELRIWDIENRFHLAGVSLCGPLGSRRPRGGPPTSTLPPVATWAVTHAHPRCMVLFARTGSAHVEALHVQRQVDKPGTYTLLTAVESKAATSKASCVTCIAAHSHATLRLLAVGTSDGVLSVYACPWFGDEEEVAAASGAGEGLGGGAQTPLVASPSAGEASPDDDEADLNGGGLGKTASKTGQQTGVPAGAGAAGGAKKQAPGAESGRPGQGDTTLLFSAAVSPDIVTVGGKLRKASVAAAMQAAAAAGQNPATVPTESYYDMVSALAWHPTLPLLAAADGTGRIVVWRVGVSDGLHSVVASRNWCVPPTAEDMPRVVTSLTFHATLLKLVSLAYAPQAPGDLPVLSAWCTGHASLPPLPSPTSPALAAQMDAAVSNPMAHVSAHLTQAPALLSRTSATPGHTSVVWLSGRAIPVHEVASSCKAIGDVDEEDNGRGDSAGGRGGEPLPDPTVVVPLVPHDAGGVVFGAPVVDVMSAPRSWFVTGGEGETLDNGQDEEEEGDKAGNAAKDDLNSGSLAEFAARLTLSASAKAKAEEPEAGGAAGAASLTKRRLKKRADPPEMQLSMDAVLYVQTRVEAGGDPPRIAAQHSLHARPLGAAGGSSGEEGASSVAGGSNAGRTGAPLPAAATSKRLCWLPSYGPGGPLVPLSIQRSPSGRYLLVRFGYLSEMSPGRVQDEGTAAAEQAAAVTFKQAQSVLLAAKKKGRASDVVSRSDSDAGEGEAGLATVSGQPGAALALTNGAVGVPSDQLLFVVVGPLTDAVDADSGLPRTTAQSGETRLSFSALSRLPVDVPVTPLASAVDATLLVGDRLLTVRRPLHAVVGGAASTEYVVTIDPLDPDLDALAAAEDVKVKDKSKVERDLERLGQAIKASAEKDLAKIKAGFDSIGDKMKANAEKDLGRIKQFFGVKGEGTEGGADKDERKAEGTDKEDVTSGAHAGGTDGRRPSGANSSVAAAAHAKHVPSKPVRFAVHDPVSRVFPTPFHPPSSVELQELGHDKGRRLCATEHPASGHVLLFATRWRHPDDAGSPSSSRDRVVLRFSANAFGRYSESNPHGYAVVDAYTPTAPPSLAKTWRVEHTLEAKPIGHTGASGAPGEGGRGRGRTDSHASGEGGAGGNKGAHGTNVLTKQSSFVGLPEPLSHGAEDDWSEHQAASSRCPVNIRPALVLTPGEHVIRASWQAGEGVWGDRGTHAVGEEKLYGGLGATKGKDTASVPPKHGGIPPAAPKGAGGAPPSTSSSPSPPGLVHMSGGMTLPQAIATGGPLLALLTTHRLLIVTPALQLLAALPVLAPVGGAGGGVGLGHTSPGWGDRASPASTALACAHFGVWRGMFSSPTGHGQGFGGAALTESARISSLPPLVPEEGEGEDEEGRAGGASVDSTNTRTVALGAGYVGVIDGTVAHAGAALLEGQVQRGGGAATASAAARASSLALPIASPSFGLPAAGLAPSDSSASFVSGVQVNTVASAAASADRLISALPCARLADTVPHDDVSDEVVAATRWTTPVVGHSWLGSALMVTTASGEIWYVTPLGRARRSAVLAGSISDASVVCATADRLVFAASNPTTGRLQVRTRAFSPVEPLVSAALDHSATRPRPLVALLGGSGASAGQGFESPSHPVVAALSHTLTMSMLVYGARKERSKDKGSGGSPEVLVLTGQAAIAGLALAALARDYCFVRDAVVRYAGESGAGGGGGREGDAAPAQPSRTTKDGPSCAWGISRQLVGCLEERGLLDLAFFVAQGSPTGSEAARTSSSAGEQGDVDDDTPPHWLPWLDKSGQRTKASLLPWHWRSSLALKRGRFDHAVWALVGEDPALASALVALTQGRAGSGAGLEALADYDPASVKLPSPFSPLAARLRVLGRLLVSCGHLRGALLAFDVAGDYSASLAVLCLGAAGAVLRVAREKKRKRAQRSLDDDEDEVSTTLGAARGVEGSLPLSDLDAALGSLLGPAKDRYPAVALTAALHRRSMLDDEALFNARESARKRALSRKRAGLSGRAQGGGGEDEEEEEERSGTEEDEEEDDTTWGEQDGDAAAGSASLLDTLRSACYPPTLDKSARAESLLSVDHGIGASASQVSAQARRMLELHALTAAPALALCPYLALVDDTMAAVLRTGRETSKRLLAASHGAPVTVPTPHGTLDGHTALAGGTIGASTPDALPSRHVPLAFDSIQRWLGSAVPALLRSVLGGGGGSTEDGEEGEDGGLFGMSLEGMLGVGASDKDVDPSEACRQSACGKRKLRALPRGAEDAVVGYWRFDKCDGEGAGEVVRAQEVKRKGGAPPAGSPPGGLWGFTSGGGGSVEAISPWHASPVGDLSRQACHGAVFDALFLLARAEGAARAGKDAASALAQTLVPTASAGVSDLNPFLRVGLGGYDSPCDPGDPGKVREPRVLVAGIGTVADPSGGKATALVKTAAKVALHKLLQPNVSCGGGPGGLEPVPFSPFFHQLSPLFSWAVVMPVQRYSYCDIGVRPWDAVTGAWTFEAWVKPGSPFAGSGGPRGVGGERDGEEEDAPSTGVSLDRDVIIAARVERLTPSSVSIQWQLSVQANGALCFTAFPSSSTPPSSTAYSSALPPASTIASKPGAVSIGDWRHVAVVVDGSSAAKDVGSRLKALAASVDKGGEAGSVSDAPLPPASVRLFVEGVQVSEGSVLVGIPAPLVDVAGGGGAGGGSDGGPSSPGQDAFLLGPDFVGRLAEARVWAKKRTATDLTDTKDFHLDCAETARKARMAVNIRPATLPPAAVSTTLPAAPVAAQVAATVRPLAAASGLQPHDAPGAAAPTAAPLPKKLGAAPPGGGAALPAPTPAGGAVAAPTASAASSRRKLMGGAAAKGGSADGGASTSADAGGLPPTAVTAPVGPAAMQEEEGGFDSGFSRQAPAAVEEQAGGRGPPSRPADDGEEDAPAPRPKLGVVGGLGGGGGGLGVPPPGVGGGKKAALLRARAAAAVAPPPAGTGM